MKLKKIFYIILSTFLMCSMCLSLPGCEKSPEDIENPTESKALDEFSTDQLLVTSTEKPTENLKKYDVTKYDINKYVSPIWSGNISYAESCFIAENEDGIVKPIQLLYPIDKIISVRSPDYSIIYTEGKDYIVNEYGELEILEDGRIPVWKYNELYFRVTTSRDEWLANNPGKGMWWYANHPNMAIVHKEITKDRFGMMGGTVSVTYKHSTPSIVTAPLSARYDFYTDFIEKLENGETVNILSMGDSITEGWSASGHVNIAPYTPPYDEMVVDYIEMLYPKAKINHTNIAVSGTGIQHGVAEEKLSAMCKANPDFVFLAYGGNNGGMPTANFISNLNIILNRLKSECPDAVAVVVGHGYQNAEMSWTNGGSSIMNGVGNTDFIMAFSEACREDSKNWTNAAFADVGLVNRQMLEYKKYLDITGSNSNHPNDYMHRVYAQVIIQTVFGTLD